MRARRAPSERRQVRTRQSCAPPAATSSAVHAAADTTGAVCPSRVMSQRPEEMCLMGRECVRVEGVRVEGGGLGLGLGCTSP